MTDTVHRGLDGIVVTESALSKVDGEAGRLIYRGYPIEELARECTYEEVLHLLWYGSLPTRDELAALADDLAAARTLDDGTAALVADLAAADEEPMAAVRTAASRLSGKADRPDGDPSDAEEAFDHGLAITAKLPTILAAFDRERRGAEPVDPDPDLDHASNFLYMLNGEEPDEVLAETFDAALVMHADHGINASTFSAMVTASTVADIYAAVTSAIGTLSGPLHGGANQDVMRMLLEIDESALDPADWIEETLDAGERVPGFGHRVYDVKDPRAYILGEMSESLGEAAGDLKWHRYCTAIEETMDERLGLPPNVDFYSATTYYQMDIPVDLYTPIFALSRVGGWVAHVLEQYEDNRIMRPRSRYVGETDRTVTPIEDR